MAYSSMCSKLAFLVVLCLTCEHTAATNLFRNTLTFCSLLHNLDCGRHTGFLDLRPWCWPSKCHSFPQRPQELHRYPLLPLQWSCQTDMARLWFWSTDGQLSHLCGVHVRGRQECHGQPTARDRTLHAPTHLGCDCVAVRRQWRRKRRIHCQWHV